MNGKAPRRPRESKRRRCAFVVGEECGNVPAPCQTSLKGVRPHSAGVGKPGRDGAHTRRARLQLHRPIRGYMEEEKKRRKKERRKSKEERGSGGLYHAFAFVLWPPPPFPIIHPLPSTHKLEVRVCASKFAYGPPPPPPPPPPLDFGVCLGWCSLRGWGVRACTVNYLCGPGMEESGQGCIWRSSFYPTHESVLSVIPGMPTLRRCIDNIKQGKRWKWAYLCRYLCKTKCLYEPDNACFATQWGFKRWHDQFPDLLECKPLFGTLCVHAQNKLEKNSGKPPRLMKTHLKFGCGVVSHISNRFGLGKRHLRGFKWIVAVGSSDNAATCSQVWVSSKRNFDKPAQGGLLVWSCCWRKTKKRVKYMVIFACCDNK